MSRVVFYSPWERLERGPVEVRHDDGRWYPGVLEAWRHLDDGRWRANVLYAVGPGDRYARDVPAKDVREPQDDSAPAACDV